MVVSHVNEGKIITTFLKFDISILLLQWRLHHNVIHVIIKNNQLLRITNCH